MSTASGTLAPADPFEGLPPDSARLTAVRLHPINEYGAEIDAMEPSVSPNGRYVVFGGWSDVFLYDLRTGKTTTLCHNLNPHEFTWNAAGDWIAFAGEWRDPPGYMPFCIWLVRPDGSGLHRIPGSGPDDRHPVWSPDGRSLVWTRGRRLCRSDTVGGAVRFLTRAPSDAYHLEYARGWTADRVHLRYLAGSEMGEQFRLRLVGADSIDDAPDPSRIPVVMRSEIGALANGSLLYRGVENVLEFVEPGASGRVRRVLVRPDLHVWHPSVAEDRSVAVFEVGDEEEAHLWMVRLKARIRGRR